ncbi:hypothetical protein GCM10022199_16270 [Marihabitans asiaticum]|uniref:Leader peptidase (Prepilin peptidase)/N-methyltransferase n=1 Tax=Marihabitans asiaticum TaxID=415218 RepID=A0A560W837_9MICO|nr:A24 family peptidase [Marihabitans asiaticum]TWD13685.1 leader peptidase (prepilin peptidase)/N-methyltransferase [Marihabitans asiaticum]
MLPLALACLVLTVGTWLAWRWVAAGSYRREGEGGEPASATPPRLRHLVLAAPALGGALVWAHRDEPAAVVVLLAALAPFTLALTVADLDVHRLPNALTLPAVPGTLALLALAAATSGRWEDLVRSIWAAGLVGGAFVVVSLALGSRGLGMGDAKLMLSLAPLLAWHGWAVLATGVYLGFLFGGLAALVLLLARRATRGSHLAFGPYLLAGAVCALLAAR